MTLRPSEEAIELRGLYNDILVACPIFEQPMVINHDKLQPNIEIIQIWWELNKTHGSSDWEDS